MKETPPLTNTSEAPGRNVTSVTQVTIPRPLYINLRVELPRNQTRNFRQTLTRAWALCHVDLQRNLARDLHQNLTRVYAPTIASVQVFRGSKFNANLRRKRVTFRCNSTINLQQR